MKFKRTILAQTTQEITMKQISLKETNLSVLYANHLRYFPPHISAVAAFEIQNIWTSHFINSFPMTHTKHCSTNEP